MSLRRKSGSVDFGQSGVFGGAPPSLTCTLLDSDPKLGPKTMLLSLAIGPLRLLNKGGPKWSHKKFSALVQMIQEMFIKHQTLKYVRV